MHPHKKSVQTLEILKIEFSRCFKCGNNKIPLAVNIYHDLHIYYAYDTRFTKISLKKAINLYMFSKECLKNMKIGQYRINLYGNTTTQITQREEDYAQFILIDKQRKKLMKLKKFRINRILDNTK